MTPLELSISIVGSQSKLARAIGCKGQLVNNWLRRGRVPADACPAIERATKGAVRCEDLRPDVDWGYLRGTAVEVPQELQLLEGVLKVALVSYLSQTPAVDRLMSVLKLLADPEVVKPVMVSDQGVRVDFHWPPSGAPCSVVGNDNRETK